MRLKLFVLTRYFMRFFVLAALVFIGLNSCKQEFKQQDLIGAWKVDSTYSYYNGFDYNQTQEGRDWATYVYTQEGVMKEIKHGSFRSYFFTFHPVDSLNMRSTQGGDEFGFKILELSQRRMVLKKIKAPIFGGANQSRYEIRYLSRTEVPKDEALPFNDPRQ